MGWHSFLWVFLGGGLGSCLRFFASKSAVAILGTDAVSAFPWSTLCVNTLGCFLIGWLCGLPQGLSVEIRLLLVTGFLGGLTTFSTYEFESYLLLQEGTWGRALINLLGSLGIGLLAVWAGSALARGYLWKP
ncbi:MAG: fluoride efflux transporter CrcB [Cyanobacteria bacterium]|nr:fluoride efflux transporter CrcB [Cyanobacteriota bacterium]